MPDGLDIQAGADDAIDFQPLTAIPKQAARPLGVRTATRPTQAGDDIDFQPTEQPKPTTEPASTISPREPSFGERMKNVFTEGAPSGSFLGRLSSRVYQPGDEKREMQLIRPEAAMTPTEQRRHPVLTGAGELAGSLTTPQNVGIMAGTAGLGSLPGAAGRLLPRLVSGYFSLQMLKGAYDQYPEFRRAVDANDQPEAQRLLTHIVGNVALSGLAGRHALRRGGAAAPVSPSEETAVRERPALPPARWTTPPPGMTEAEVTRGPFVREASGEVRPGQPSFQYPPVIRTQETLPRPALRRPMLALPPARPTPVETIGGEPVQVRIFPSDEPLITPEPTRTQEGAILTRPSLLSTRKLLPPARAPLPPEESEFLAGKPGPVPPLTSAVRPGPVESYAEGYRPRLTTSLAVRTAPSTPDIDFKPLTEQPAATKPNGKAAAAAQASAHAMGVGPPPDAVRSAIRRFRDIKEEMKQGPPLQTAAEASAVVRAREGAPPVTGPKLRLGVTPRSESLKTYYSLSPEARDYVDNMAREMGRMPQVLRDARMEELRQYGGKGTMLKERLAQEALKDAPEQARGKAVPAGAPSVDVQIRELQARERALTEQASRARAWPRTLELQKQAKAVNEKWQALKAKQGGGPAKASEIGPSPGTRPVEATGAERAKQLGEALGQGEMRLRSGVNSLGEELSTGELEAIRKSVESTRAELESLQPKAGEGVLPGMETAVEEQKAAAGTQQGKNLTAEMNRPAESANAAIGELETKSPLFRGTEASPQEELFKQGSRLSAGVDPTMLREGTRIAQQAWQEKIARPFIDKVLKIGDKYQKARAADPAVAEGLHLLDNAPQYLRQKAAQQVHEVIGNLSRAQERLFVLMADADSRENLRANHPAEYREALNDRIVQEALRKYQPLERELTATRQRLGGETLEGDYLKRVYDKYVAGIGKEQAPGSAERGTSAYDRVIRPQRIGNMSREAAAEYHYKNGLHELGPAFATKFIGTNLRALRDTVAKEFLSKATQLEPGASEPRSIEYGGERYYRPDIAVDMPKGTKVYDRYDPTAGEKFPQAADGKFLGPREVVNALNDFGRREDAQPGALRRFFQEQVIGFGFGVPHVANILRRVTQSVPGGALSPKGWADAWRVAFSKELRERGVQGINDPTFDKLLRQGAITTGEMSNLKKYWGGNWNPANWARAMAQVGHKVLFEPGSAGGFGGIDQRARIHIADLIRSQRPELSDEQIASGVRDALGDYNRANWSDRQKMLAKFMMFPGWDASSIRWVIQHPIRTTVPPAVLVYLANQTLHQIGANRAEDKSDIDTIHLGDRAYGTGLLRESVARNLFRPFINYAQVKLQGGNEQHAQAAAARGLTSGAGGLLGMLRPDLSGFIALAANRQALFSGKELLSREDFSAPGKLLPSRALEKMGIFALRKAIPSLDRMLDSDQELDLKSFAGGNLGLPNYRDDAERRLVRNAAEAEETYQTVSKLAKTNPAQAREYMRDPDNAAYALFHRDFAQVVAALKRIDQTREHIEASGLTAAEKKSRGAALDKSRQTLLGHADALNNLLFERRQKAPQPRLAPGFLNQPRPRIPLAVQ